jgi:hypothetical protein
MKQIGCNIKVAHNPWEKDYSFRGLLSKITVALGHMLPEIILSKSH